MDGEGLQSEADREATGHGQPVQGPLPVHGPQYGPKTITLNCTEEGPTIKSQCKRTHFAANFQYLVSTTLSLNERIHPLFS